MPAFTEELRCAAPAEEVWKLLYDPWRYPEWWTGTDAVTGGEGGVARHSGGSVWPTAVEAGRVGEQVVISCVLTDIVFRWTLAPDAGGCRVRLEVAIPDREAARLGMQETAMRDAIVRLARAAERAVA
ncbi:SRPBCC family protein [Miltoncostaea marina]|uniref:SRPBCC family protein n=1 Tax=Miltoncostaea marina TaxID=2843215 RepID=UPI001C3C394D|nr:SRPBCC family protein [Miltoncostaea marina]